MNIWSILPAYIARIPGKIPEDRKKSLSKKLRQTINPSYSGRFLKRENHSAMDDWLCGSLDKYPKGTSLILKLPLPFVNLGQSEKLHRPLPPGIVRQEAL